jgi:hypothetical protein
VVNPFGFSNSKNHCKRIFTSSQAAKAMLHVYYKYISNHPNCIDLGDYLPFAGKLSAFIRALLRDAVWRLSDISWGGGVRVRGGGAVGMRCGML